MMTDNSESPNKLGHLLKSPYAIIVILFSLFVFHILTLTTAPQPFVDEGLSASRAASYKLNQTPIGELDRRTIELQSGTGADRSIGPYFFYALLLPDDGVVTIDRLRMMNLFFGMILVLAVYLVGLGISGGALGALSAIVFGTSLNFMNSAHLARVDIMGITLAFLALGLVLACPANKWLHLTAGFLVVIALEFHPRALIGLPVLAAALIAKYGASIFKKTEILLVASGAVLGIFVYSMIHIFPDPAAYISGFSAQIGNRMPPAGTGNTEELVSHLRHLIYPGLMFFGWLGWLALICPFLAAVRWKTDGRLVLIILLTSFFSAPMLMDYVAQFNAIIVAPSTALAAGFVVYRILCFRHLKFFTLDIVSKLIFGTASLAAITIPLSRYIQNAAPCQDDFAEVSEFLNSLIGSREFIVADETYWLNFQDSPFMSWKTLNTYMRTQDSPHLIAAFKHFKPDIFIIDQFLAGFIIPAPIKIGLLKEIWLPEQELYSILENNAQLIGTKQSQCFGNLGVFRFDWSKM